MVRWFGWSRCVSVATLLVLLAAACGSEPARVRDDHEAGSGGDESGEGGSSEPKGGSAVSGGSTGGSTGGDAGLSGGAAAGEAGSTAQAGSAGSGPGVDAPPELTWAPAYEAFATNAIWGSGPDDVYFVGQGGSITHWNGTDWELHFPDTSAHLTGIWGAGPDDIHVSTYSNAMLHSTGGGVWTKQVLDLGWTFEDVWGASATEVVATFGGFIRYGEAGTWGGSEGLPGTYGGIKVSGTSANDLWFINSYGEIQHYLGPDNVRVQYLGGSTVAERAAFSVRSIEVVAADDIYVGCKEGIYHSTGNGVWTNQYPWPGDGDSVSDIFALNATTLYATTLKGFVLRSGGDGRWLRQTIPDTNPDTPPSLKAVWASSPQDVYVAETWGIYHGTAP